MIESNSPLSTYRTALAKLSSYLFMIVALVIISTPVQTYAGSVKLADMKPSSAYCAIKANDGKPCGCDQKGKNCQGICQDSACMSTK
jgi:hypothetical protein